MTADLNDTAAQCCDYRTLLLSESGDRWTPELVELLLFRATRVV
ncbi:hypothetical protein OG400_25950 [Micromonospora ureilytica]|nr:hypothetical protein OG400_25950 [Micromonospora ureilytica]